MLSALAVSAEEARRPGRKEIPTVFPGGVVNAAGFVPAPDNFVAPLSIIAIFGKDLSLRTAEPSVDPGGGRLPVSLGGVQVLIGNLPAPLFFVSADQINAQVPRRLVPRERPWPIEIRREGLRGPVGEVHVRAVAPGLFPVVVHQDFRLVGRDPLRRSTPTHPGRLIVLFGTGFGIMQPPADTGLLSSRPAEIIMPSSVWIEERMLPAENVLYVGQTPGFAGLQQVNVLLPEDLAPGDPQIFLEVAGAWTQPEVRVAVDPAPPSEL